jgi:hypothetical protein
MRQYRLSHDPIEEYGLGFDLKRTHISDLKELESYLDRKSYWRL